MQNRRAFTLVEIMIVVLIIGILLAVATPQWIKARENSRTKACLKNLQTIESAKTNWAIENRMAETSTPTAGDLAPDFVKGTMPVCPSGGTYTIGVVTAEPVCSTHGAPSTFAP